MNMLVSGVALLLACAALFVYDQITFRQTLVHTLSAQAQIIGSNSVSAILFSDPQAAARTLSALKSSPSIASAGILTINRGPFAQFTRASGDELFNVPPLPPGELEAYWFQRKHVILVREILSEGKPIGFALSLPDLNMAFMHNRRGYLLPGLWCLWRYRKRINRIRIIVLGVPPVLILGGLVWLAFRRNTERECSGD